MTMTTIVDLDPSTPGALLEYKTRALPDGSLVEFEFAPAGFLTKKGETRLQDWRAYFHTPPEGKRKRLLSVTTILDAILPKGGLPRWAEARGIEGAVIAMGRGEIGPGTDPADGVEVVRALKLGADRARDTAAERGLNVHALLEDFMRTSNPPRLADHPVEHHGYVQALCSWLLERDPEPEAVEELVAHPEAGYAGRRDLVAKCGGIRIGFDAKTQENCGIYAGAHIQLRMYEQAAIACGSEPCDELRVVAFAADGRWREMPCEASEMTMVAALAFADVVRPIDALCESANRRERKARA